jgi:hypothetical protein
MYLTLYLNRLSLLLVVSGLLTGSLGSQEPAPGLDNLAVSSPSMAAWSLTYRELGTAITERDFLKSEKVRNIATTRKSGKRILRSAAYTRSGEIGHAVFNYSDGTSEEHYVVKDVALQKDPKSTAALASVVDSYTGELLRFTQSYPGVAWVKAGYFVKRMTIDGEPLLHFHQGAADRADPKNAADALAYDPDRATTDRDAWFSETTRLPVAFRVGSVLARYLHLAPPSEPILLPEPFQKALREYLSTD